MSRWLLLAQDKGSVSGSFPAIDDWETGHYALADPSAHVGDAVVLWRAGRGGGAVALGAIVETAVGDEDPAWCRVRVRFDTLFLSTPLPADRWGVPQLGRVVRDAGAVVGARGVLARLALTDRQWEALLRWVEHPAPATEWVSAWNIPAGAVVSRSQLHDVYGGNSRVWAGPSGKTRNVFLFLNRSPAGAELMPRLSQEVLLAPGHTQTDRYLSVENLAVLGHLRRGLPLRVFETRRGECLYVGEFAVIESLPVARWVDTGEQVTPYGTVRQRQVPILRLRQVSGVPPIDGGTSFDGAPRVALSLRLADGGTAPTPPAEPAGSAVPAVPVAEQAGPVPGPDRTSGAAPGAPGAEAVRRLLGLLERDPAAAKAVGAIDEAQALAALVQQARRQADLAELRAVAEDPDSLEADLQRCLERMTWIFGGEFLSRAARRDLTAQDQLDLSLIRPDSTLHGVEIKKARIRSLVKRHRSHLTVGADINDATGQALNYLRSLDEHRHQILADFGIDCRRATMTVVIGHASFVSGPTTRAEVAETLRTYNSNMARISVVTYDQLIDTAQRTLALTEPAPARA
ncbi:Shedu anti-phage system protein SduA domain-containing protein [Kitasatospora sp. NPDC002040]|uniref:Shedu anti-phage system protein SduA domain-containing protein n=1 Tax=Kitasatospora sp. NPDC002040 TaxID=3154661 RepID=UPI0033261E4A